MEELFTIISALWSKGLENKFFCPLNILIHESCVL